MNAAEAGESCADILKVLADETRLGVVRQLLTSAKNVSEINEELNVEKSLLSHHLKILREAGIVEARREGKAVRYNLSPGVESRRRGKGLDLGCCRITFD